MELTKLKDFILKRTNKKGADIIDIAKELEVEPYIIYGAVEMLKADGQLIDIINGQIVRLNKPNQINDTYVIPNNLEHLKLLLISDTHLCSKYDRLDILKYLYEKAQDRGVKYILHSGDFTDGKSNRPEHMYELKELSYTGQVDYCINKYPKYDGKTFVIQGNHDSWWYKSAGSEIVKSISKERDDIVYLGPDVAEMKIGKLKIRLFHGFGAPAYARSYKAQKYLDAIPTEERPDILQMGHIHQAFYMKQGDTHVFQTGSLEDMTPYTRSLGMGNEKSVWWLDITLDDKGNIYSIIPELETFDKKIKVKK